jgi:hypothetical protein
MTKPLPSYNFCSFGGNFSDKEIEPQKLFLEFSQKKTCEFGKPKQVFVLIFILEQ